MIDDKLLPLFEGGYPSCIITSSSDGIPNITNLTRVWNVDAEHVAIANQFLRKTLRNLEENPLALMRLVHPADLRHWELAVRYVRSEREGALYDRLQQDIQTLSWIAGAEEPAELRTAMLFEALSIRECAEESLHLQSSPEVFGDMLNALSDALDWSRMSYWLPSDGRQDVSLLVSRGVPGAGVNPNAFSSVKRLAEWAVAKQRPIRLRNVRSQLRYMKSIRSHASDKGPFSPSSSTIGSSYLALPIVAFDDTIGIVCCEETAERAEALNRLEDGFLAVLSVLLGEALAAAASIAETERSALFKQAIERAMLQWSKASDPFHSTLSARERQVAVHVAEGHTNAEIAKRLFVSPRTVTTHLERIFLKLQVNSRAALTRYVMEKGFLTDRSDSSENT